MNVSMNGKRRNNEFGSWSLSKSSLGYTKGAKVYMNREQLEKYVKSFGVTERRARKELNERYKMLKPLGFSDEKIFKVLVQGSPLDHRTLQAFHHRTKKIHGRSRKRIFKLLNS